MPFLFKICLGDRAGAPGGVSTRPPPPLTVVPKTHQKIFDLYDK
nr:MAG TPA: hypothetical protein [Caudoviricetes sp.]